MKKYIIQYDHYDELVSILGDGIPHSNLNNVNTVIVDLYEEEYLAIKNAGYNIIPDVSIKGEDALCYTPTNMTFAVTPPTALLDYYNLTNSHAAGFTGVGVKVAVIDTGQHDNHHAAAPAVTRHDFTVGQTGIDGEPISHGGRACIIIGQTNLFTGTATPGAPALYGMAYGCDLHSMRIMEDDGGVFTSAIVTSLDYAVENNFHIVNLSLQLLDGSFDNALQACLDAGIIVVCASGNNIGAPMTYPARYPNVIAVNAWFAGSVGGSYLSTPNPVTVTNYNSGHTTFVGGTSQAAFMLTGLLALYKQKYPSLNTAKAIHLLRRRAFTMDGYTYNTPSTSRNVLLDATTGAGFVAPLN